MEGELEQKQNFLRMNILERGYDAEKFMNFLQSKKGDLGLDLNNWSLNELTLAVQEFMILISNQNMNNEQEMPQNNNNENNNSNSVQIDVVNDPNQKQIQSQSQEEFIPCEKVVPNELTLTKGTDIKLSFPEKVEGSLFTKSYVTYLMQTTPMGFSIRKRYSDFEWLRNVLSTIYVNCVIPPLCKKNYADRFNELLISKRTRSIEKFMKGVLIHPLMRNSEIFYNFISIEKESDFDKKKKEYNRLSSPVILNQVKSLDGQLKVTISKEKEIYFENIKDYLNLNEDLLQKITKGHKALILLMEQLGDKMKELSDLWKAVYQQNLKYFEKPNTTTSFDILSKIMLDWNEINKKQKILINEGIREYFRYVKNEFRGIKDLALKVENNKTIYTKAFDKLIALKENVFKQDISHWGINALEMEDKTQLLTNKNLAFAKMLPKDTRKVDELRQIYGFYLNSIISEFERIRELNGIRHKNTINSFIEQFTESLKDFQVYLSDRASYYDDIKDEEKGEQEKNSKEQNNEENENKN
jgi:sorting nexin-7/30/sorting nexin-8